MLKRCSRVAYPITTLHNHPQKFLFIGAPGVGKGTYSTRLCRDTGYAHISTGDLLRKEVADLTPVGKEAKTFMDTGDLVPSGLVDEMVKNKLLELERKKVGFVLDGYPRNLEQAKTMDEYIKIDHCIDLHQPFDVIEAKISGRRTCSNCGEGYNTADIDVHTIKMEPLMPKKEGVCDACGEEMTLLQRGDDRLEVVRHRLEVYTEITRPLEKNYADIYDRFDVLGSTRIYYPKFLEFLKAKVHVTP